MVNGIQVSCGIMTTTIIKSRELRGESISQLRTAEFILSRIILHGKGEFNLSEEQRQRLAEAEQAIYEVVNSLERR